MVLEYGYECRYEHGYYKTDNEIVSKTIGTIIYSLWVWMVIHHPSTGTIELGIVDLSY